MNMNFFLIAAMLLIQFSIYAQTTGQVTLSIRLYPIQTIEVAPPVVQTIELFNEEATDSLTSSSQLSTFSTSQHAVHVDSVNSKPFEMLRSVRDASLHIDDPVEKFFATEKYDRKTDGDDLHIMYSMETL